MAPDCNRYAVGAAIGWLTVAGVVDVLPTSGLLVKGRLSSFGTRKMQVAS